MGFFDDVGDFFSDAADAVWGGVTTVVNGILDTLESIFGGLLDALAWIVEGILSIPWIGGFLRDLWNLILTIVWSLVSIVDFILTLLGIMPEKRLKLCVIIQLDESGNPVASDAQVMTYLQMAIDVFKSEPNVRVLPLGPFVYSSAFQDTPKASDDYYTTMTSPSSAKTLDVNCGGQGLADDLGPAGSRFNYEMGRYCFWGNFRRLIGYGSPIAAFTVRRFTGGDIGCSMGPLADYVLVDFSARSPRTLPHEMGHACNLWHESDASNLMTKTSDGGTGTNLSRWQKALLRSSRHVTYF